MATAEIKAGLSLDGSQFTAGLNRARNEAKSFSGFTNDLGRQMASIFMGGAALGFAKAAIGGSAELKHIAENLDISTDKLQAFRDIALASGVGVEALQRALGKLKISIDDAFSNEKTAAKFAALGISIDQLSKAGDVGEVFAMLGRGVAQANDPMVAFGAVADLIGAKAAPRMIQALREIGQMNLAQKLEEMQHSGRLMSEETVDAAEKIGTAWERLKNTTASWFLSLGNALGSIPSMITAPVRAMRDAEGQIAEMRAERLRRDRETREGVLRERPGMAPDRAVNKRVDDLEKERQAMLKKAALDSVDSSGKLLIIEKEISELQAKRAQAMDEPIKKQQLLNQITALEIQAEKQRQEIREQTARQNERMAAEKERQTREQERLDQEAFDEGARLYEQELREQEEKEREHQRVLQEIAGTAIPEIPVDEYTRMGGTIGRQLTKPTGDAALELQKKIYDMQQQKLGEQIKKLDELYKMIDRKPGGLPA